jgi:hypothetical protein
MRLFSRARRDSTEHDERMAIDADDSAEAATGVAPAAAARAGSSSSPRGLLRGLSRSGPSRSNSSKICLEEQEKAEETFVNEVFVGEHSFAGALPAAGAPAPAREGRSPRRRSFLSGSSKAKAEAAPEPQEGDDLGRARGEAPAKERRSFRVFRLASFKKQVLPVA